VIEAFINLFRVKEIRQRLFFTLVILGVYRLGFWLPLPGINSYKLAEVAVGKGLDFLNLINMLSAGNLLKGTLFGLGIMPYITATIVFQLLIGVIPSLEALAKEGEAGQKKIRLYQRYAALLICFFQAMVVLNVLRAKFGNTGAIETSWWFMLRSAFFMCSGTMILMWLGDMITERGVGNGISLLIMAGILARLPTAYGQLKNRVSFDMNAQGKIGLLGLIFLLAAFVAIVAGVVVIYMGIRKIPMQHARHIRGRRMTASQRNYLPLRINQAGVMPIIFASSLLMFPTIIFSMLQKYYPGTWGALEQTFRPGYFMYTLIYLLCIFFFAYFWTSMQFRPKEMAENLKEYGAFIPGIRPGRWTAEYLESVMIRITFAGGIFLALVAIMPQMLGRAFNIGYVTQFYGGTSLLIAVAVSIELADKLESLLIMRHYRGFWGGEGSSFQGVRKR